MWLNIQREWDEAGYSLGADTEAFSEIKEWFDAHFAASGSIPEADIAKAIEAWISEEKPPKKTTPVKFNETKAIVNPAAPSALVPPKLERSAILQPNRKSANEMVMAVTDLGRINDRMLKGGTKTTIRLRPTLLILFG